MLLFKEHETKLVEDIEAYMDTQHPEASRVVREWFICLQDLGETISRYPSVRGATQILRGEQRDEENIEENLIEALCSSTSASHVFHTPTSVVAVRSFLVAKLHAFSLLALLVRDIHDFYHPLRTVIFSIICTLMGEQVYFSCLEDPSFSHSIKMRLAKDLIAFWDRDRDPRGIRHFPALEALWIARNEAPPSFGTMDGTSELIRVSMALGNDWQDFLVKMADSNDEITWALEEFLFGLSYEEIGTIRSRLARFGISAVGHDEVLTYIGSRPAYGLVPGNDPRAMYNFYVDRRDAAFLRKRFAAPGPTKTLEQLYLKYRISLD